MQQKICIGCGSVWKDYPSRLLRQTFCSSACANESKRRTLEERFWKYVMKADDCWPWIGTTNHDGYGVLRTRLESGRRQSTFAHRVSWQMHYGEITEGLEVCHKCDNPPCVKPEHLFLATHIENIRDATVKGRMRGLRGELNWNAKLTDKMVLEIHLMTSQGVSRTAIAKHFNVSTALISAIARRQIWKHVLPKPEQLDML